MSRNHNLPRMATTRITVRFILLLMAFATGIAADGGKLLVDTYGKLLLIGPDGSSRCLANPSLWRHSRQMVGMSLLRVTRILEHFRRRRRSFRSFQSPVDLRNRSQSC